MPEEKHTHILYFSKEKLDCDINSLRENKQNLKNVLKAAAHDYHAYPSVGLVGSRDDKKAVEYNVMVELPKSWVVQNDEVDKIDFKIPKSAFTDLFLRENGVSIDQNSFHEACDQAGLSKEEIGKEFLIQNIRLNQSIGEIVAVSDSFSLLRDKEGKPTYAGSSYTGEIPDLPEVGYVAGPKDEGLRGQVLS